MEKATMKENKKITLKEYHTMEYLKNKVKKRRKSYFYFTKWKGA